MAFAMHIAAVLPGQMFRSASPSAASPPWCCRALGDSAIVTSPLIPWNSCGAYMAATLAVAAASFVAFAFFNLLNPLISVAFAFLGLQCCDRRPPFPADAIKEQPNVPGTPH